MKLLFSAEIAQVIAPYTATGLEQLTLAPGQLILIRKKNPGGWWEGELQVCKEYLFICTYFCISVLIQRIRLWVFSAGASTIPHLAVVYLCDACLRLLVWY